MQDDLISYKRLIVDIVSFSQTELTQEFWLCQIGIGLDRLGIDLLGIYTIERTRRVSRTNGSTDLCSLECCLKLRSRRLIGEDWLLLHC